MEPDLREIVEANSDFYSAFESMDFERMVEVWHKEDSDICIHPGWEILRGWEEIRESWRAIFASASYLRFELTELQVVRIGSIARVTCIENLYSVADGTTSHARVAATNLWVLTAQGWRISLHHGSPIAHNMVIDDDEMMN